MAVLEPDVANAFRSSAAVNEASADLFLRSAVRTTCPAKGPRTSESRSALPRCLHSLSDGTAGGFGFAAQDG
jgi:hypothetical protein